MSIIGTLKKALSEWAGVSVDQIDDTETELCILLAAGRGGDCEKILGALIPSLKTAFPEKKLGGLRVKDLKSGKLKTVQTLYNFIRTSADNP